MWFSVPTQRIAVEKQLHPRFLTVEDRERIADLYREECSLREIGRRLGRPASTIKREIDQNKQDDGSYRPFAAQRRAAEQRPRPKVSKLATRGRLREYVVSKLALQWSPEQISHTLKVEFPIDESMRVSTETIYQAIYVQARGGLSERSRTHYAQAELDASLTEPLTPDSHASAIR